MNMLTTNGDFRLLWTSLPLQTKFFLLCLFAAAIYSCVCLTTAFIRIRKLRGITPGADAEASYRRIAARLHNLRQLQLLFLLLFGLFLTDEAYRTVRSLTYLDRGFAAPSIAELLDPLLGFAFLSLLVLTILHSFQWLAFSRLETLVRRTRKPD